LLKINFTFIRKVFLARKRQIVAVLTAIRDREGEAKEEEEEESK